MTFRVGQKVVCVNDKFIVRAEENPIAGHIYTVRWVGQRNTDFVPAMMLQEISGGLHSLGIEYAFAIDRFRPVVERKTDISIFKKMLAPQGIEA